MGIEIIFSILVVGVIIGWYARQWYAVMVVTELLQQIENQEAEESHPSSIPIRIEKHEDRFFVYNSESGKFMAQGDTMDMVTENLLNNYPNKVFTISPENAEEIGIKL